MKFIILLYSYFFCVFVLHSHIHILISCYKIEYKFLTLLDIAEISALFFFSFFICLAVEFDFVSHCGTPVMLKQCDSTVRYFELHTLFESDYPDTLDKCSKS